MLEVIHSSCTFGEVKERELERSMSFEEEHFFQGSWSTTREIVQILSSDCKHKNLDHSHSLSIQFLRVGEESMCNFQRGFECYKCSLLGRKFLTINSF